MCVAQFAVSVCCLHFSKQPGSQPASQSVSEPTQKQKQKQQQKQKQKLIVVSAVVYVSVLTAIAARF